MNSLEFCRVRRELHGGMGFYKSHIEGGFGVRLWNPRLSSVSKESREDDGGGADGIGGEAGQSRTAVVNWDSRGGEPDSV